MIGKTVGKYQILERLGRGGMGIVYKALDESLDRIVAIKVLNPDIGDAELLKRFRTEAISLARLNHPGIATIYELHRHDDEMLMVMEFIRGETLQALSERLGPLEPPQAAHICIQILDALAHAHRAGVVHRDLKPANVMVTDTGIVKVMDFGIARMLGGEHFTHTGYMMGTPAFMAPEQVLGQEIDGRADLYSVGVLFYRLLSRELPFRADTAISMAQKQVAEPPTPIGTFRPDLPPWCTAVITKVLSKAPADRYQTAEEFRAALKTAVTPLNLGELPTMATPAPPGLLRTGGLTMPVLGDTLSADQTRQEPTRNTGVTPAAPTAATPAPATTTTGATATTTTGTTATSAIERTGTNVVLGRGHLITMAALVVVLIGGIAFLGYAALKRRSDAVQTTATVPVERPAESGTAGVQPNQPAPAPGVETPKPDTAATSPALPPPPVPPAGPGTAPPAGTSAATTTAARDAAKKAKPAPKVPEVTPPAEAVAPTPEPPPPPPPAPPTPEVAPVTFKAVKILTAQGDTMRERDAVLRLAGDHLSVLDRSEKAEIVTLPYSAIQQAFYSRSKQPKWKGPDGKEAVQSVDLGKMSFFRGERNWLILTTHGTPLFIRFEDGDLQKVLPTVQERAGVKIQR